jgi:putative ABC transport system ATP-binding protein
VLSLKGVRLRYGAGAGLHGARTALSLDGFEAAAGEHWLVLGASGSGKTTLLHLLAGLLRPSEGEIVIDGQPLGRMEGAEIDRWRGRTVGIVPQKLHLVQSLNVAENLLLACFLSGLPQDRDRAAGLLKGLNLEDKATARPHQLSHGQAQRVAIARAVMNRPKLLLADEPTANLDDEHCQQALELLESQAAGCGATLVVATHDQRAKQRFARRIEL